MARTVSIGNSPVQHLEAGPTFHSPLCGAVEPKPTEVESRRTPGYGDVTCTSCKRVLRAIADNVVATKPERKPRPPRVEV
jgi:hypothetical protein